ncbi:unnamed protein product [Caenorhabditis angaria]|uniref:Cytosolic endo-beta-N-acetylglucosaminidase TIM barrel domain-containing protein n=1 Tax=Caenorhabditis angaria TaxID=860376 RepID=A0A9P1IK77_9PELO|nr:unnamed protein product [Caenorhabditis angaria]
MDISPISGIQELWEWKNRNEVEPRFFEKLRNYKKKVDEAEILVCHDMQGGYLEEESCCGKTCSPTSFAYTFLNWWQIDIFNYFSHNFVTIPPASYTKIAHQHGVLSLGTFITEWIPGGKTCERIFENRKSVEDTVDGLVAVVKYYSFDGYLINIENEIDPKKIDLVYYFLEDLTRKMKKINENSRIIWYDSVTFDGKLRWQNALNSKNHKFYDSCDGIYLNYNWTDQHLLDSADFGKLSKIFVGIDVWARGCVGKWDCWKSFATAKLLRMSVAIFGTGWIHETNPGKDQVVLGIKFWKTLEPYVKTRKFQEIPFETNFGSGIDAQNQFKLSNISIQPQFLDNFSCFPKNCEGLLLTGSNTIFKIFAFDEIEVKNIKLTMRSDKDRCIHVEIENFYNYSTMCKMERVCKRWQNIINWQFRRDIHEISIERLGSSYPSAHQCIPFRRLAITCPPDSHDFLSGVFRRSRLSITRLTTDIQFLSSIDQVYVSKDANRKYFSNVEELWLLMIHPNDEVTKAFMNVEAQLFSNLQQLTLQVHVNNRSYQNVSEIVKSFILRYPNTQINLELHADRANEILNQISVLPPLPLFKIKLICTDFDQPQLRLDQLYAVMREQNVQAKNITMRDWSLSTDGLTALAYNPLDTFRISSCAIETVDNLVTSLQRTASQQSNELNPKPKKRKIVKKKKVEEKLGDEEEMKKREKEKNCEKSGEEEETNFIYQKIRDCWTMHIAWIDVFAAKSAYRIGTSTWNHNSRHGCGL